MVLIKLGEAVVISPNNIQNTESIINDIDLQINERMKRFASDLKIIAPQASDFLYFTAVMMHAAEASLIDDNGNIKIGKDGKPVTAHWEKVGKDGVRWVCSDPSIQPYRNNNSDIFPESELKVAYPKWVGRPLCLDHKSSSVEMIRGVIVDTYWDDARKRIIALCALDKKNYPDLARKVATGYATNVSMGTAVGRAVCTEHGCHRVARLESDFCDHMRRKSAYGEINLDLSPIELSLVVSGADPKAKVKQIIAKDLSDVNKAVNALQDYLEGKIALASDESDSSEVKALKEEVASLKEKLNILLEKFEDYEIERKFNEESRSSDLFYASDKNDVNYGTTGSSPDMKETYTDSGMQPFSVPEAFSSVASDLQKMILDTRVKLASITENLNKLSIEGLYNNSEESTMTTKKAYWQGTEEPTPGQKQYPVDPLGAEATQGDKQLHGQPPFPGVGPVDGMYPGYSSFGETEEARKKRLQRLAEQDRKAEIRRQALEAAKQSLEARGYWNGTEEPTPGKKQYPVDPGQVPVTKSEQAKPNTINEKEELKQKQLLSRAKLNARFRKVSTPDGRIDKASSRWDVYAGDQLILSASVNEISRGNAETVYDAIATKDFGKTIINKIVSEGFDSAKALFKSAQVPATPATAPATPAPATPAAPESASAPELEVPADLTSGDGDEGETKENIKDKITETMEQLNEYISDLTEGKDAVELEAEELQGVEPVAEEEFGVATASVQGMRRTVNAMLNENFDETIATLSAHVSELKTAKDVLKSKYDEFNNAQKSYFSTLVDSAVGDAQKTAADAKYLMMAFVRYAQGTDTVVKTAQNLPEGFEVPAERQVVNPGEPQKGAGVPVAQVAPVAPAASVASGRKADLEAASHMFDGFNADDEDLNDATVELPDSTPVSKVEDLGGSVKAANVDLTTKEGRAMHRTKLAQKGLEFSKMLDEAHPQGGHTPGELTTKPSGDLAKVETLQETSSAINDLANLPPKVRKQAREIAQLVSEGKLAVADIDQLASFGVDKDAIKYYKAYWSEAKDSASSDFAKSLVEGHSDAKKEAASEAHEIRVKRAYELAYQMRDKGMIDTSQISQQVDAIMKWNDEGFASVKSIVAKHDGRTKNASSMPQVGFLHSEEIILPAASSVSQTKATTDLSAALAARWAGKKF